MAALWISHDKQQPLREGRKRKWSVAVFRANFQITLHCLNYLEPMLLRSLLIACDIFMRCPSARILSAVAAAVNRKSKHGRSEVFALWRPVENPLHFVFKSSILAGGNTFHVCRDERRWSRWAISKLTKMFRQLLSITIPPERGSAEGRGGGLPATFYISNSKNMTHF